MTDKEKLDKLVAEIERRYNYHRDHSDDWAGTNHFWSASEDREILSFVDSMQKNPVQKFKKGDVIELPKDGFRVKVCQVLEDRYLCDSCGTMIVVAKSKQDQWKLVERSSDKCKDCNNVKGCITCVDGSEWAHYKDAEESKFKAGDVVMYVSRQPIYSGLYLLGNPNDLTIGYSNANEPYQIALRNCTIASDELRNQFMQNLNKNGYKWNESTLRIEKEGAVNNDLENEIKDAFLFNRCLTSNSVSFAAYEEWLEANISNWLCGCDRGVFMKQIDGVIEG